MLGSRFAIKSTDLRENSGGFIVRNSGTGLNEDPPLSLRVMVIDAEFYKGLRNNLYDRFGTGASLIMFEMGAGYGEVVAKSIHEMGVGRLEVYQKFMEQGKRDGYGEFSVPLLKSIVLSLKKEARVYLKNSFFANAVGKTGNVECWIVAGMIAGAARKIFGEDCQCVEVKCASKGDPQCEFYLKRS